MKYTICTFLLVSLLFLAKTAYGRISQTSDAIIIDVEHFGDERNARAMDSYLEAESSPEISAHSKAILPSGTFLMTDQSCWTSDGKFGTCTSVRSCYPNLKLPSTNELDSWILSGRGTCLMTEPDGKQNYGVCCSTKQPQIPSLFPAANPGFPFGIMAGFPGMWPSNIPSVPSPVSSVTSPPPTTTTSQPSTTSPWWVPPSTVWWVPPNTTWWVPESTTSPTWVTPDMPSSTTTRPSTTTASWTTTSQPTTTWVPKPTKPSTMKPVTTVPTTTVPVSTSVDSKFSCGNGPKKTMSFDEQARIVGGTIARRNSWPFIGALFNKRRHFCAGSLISPEHLLTAAHCVAHMSSVDVSQLEVALRMHTLKPFDPNALRKRIRRVVRHKGYNAATLYNDIAILTLDSPVQYTQEISPVCLPPPGYSDLYAGREATVIGWGALKEGGRQPDELQEVTIKVQTNDECKRNYGNDAPGGIVEHMICAAYPGKDSCSGDSGGPMVVHDADDTPWVQVGVVSWGIGCGKAPYPGVYSRVTSFLDWISKNRQ